MNRGELYRVRHPEGDPKRSRVFVVVSRPALIASKFSTVICAPMYTRRDGLETQVDVGPSEGFKHECSIHCDELVSLPKTRLTDCVGSLDVVKTDQLAAALRVALDVE